MWPSGAGVLQTEDLVIVCVCVSVLLEYCDWVCSVWPSGAGVLQTEELVIVCVCLCLVRVLRLGVKCVAKWCWSVADRGLGCSLCLCFVKLLRLGVKCVAYGAGVLQREDLVIVFVFVFVSC